jgi:hypothetical protein
MQDPTFFAFNAERRAFSIPPAVYFLELFLLFWFAANVLNEGCRRTSGEWTGGSLGEAAALLHSDWDVSVSDFQKRTPNKRAMA